MKKTIALISMIALLAVSSTAGAAEEAAVDNTAATITTSDGVLSIEVTSEEWKQKEDSEYWLEITDGKNSIVIEHLGFGEDLPDLKMADEEYKGVVQSFISTENEVFIITGRADSKEDLQDVIKTAGTIKILQYDTKTAVQKEAQAAQTTQSGIREINATYYVTADEINVRASSSQDSEAIGSLYKGEAVTVIGSVMKDGAEIGWYQIQYQGKDGYVASSFLSQTAPAGSGGSEGQQSGQGENSGKVQCEICGQWFSPDELRDHQLGHTMEDLYGDKIQCEVCGQWFSPDEIRDHQLGHTMEGMDAGN